MIYTAAITSQGQLTLPKPLRDKYRVSMPGRVMIKDTGNEIVIRPVSDFLSRFGSVKTRKPFNISKINKAVSEAISQGAVKG